MDRPFTLLIVDDDPILREAICEWVCYLRPAWISVCAKDGQEGLSLARSLHPDLILTDLHMPVMSGFQMALALREQSDTRHIPLILCTSENVFRAVEASWSVEWGAVIFKPTLFATIDTAFEQALSYHKLSKSQ